MCIKLYEYISNDHWGIHVTVYQGEKVYCFVVADRDGTNYYLVDFEFNRFYPVTSQAVRTASAHEDRSHDEIVARLLDLDLSKFGSGKCAPHARSFAKQMQEDLAAGIKVKFSPPRKQRRIWDYFRRKCKKEIDSSRRILSGSASLPLLVFYLCIEIGCILLCSLADVTYILLIVWSIMCVFALLVFNRLVTIVTYDPEKEIITRRGLFGGFHKELCVADILRTEVRMIPKEQEYILLIDKEMPYFDSLSPDMPIRIPNTTKGRSFVALFYGSEH